MQKTTTGLPVVFSTIHLCQLFYSSLDVLQK
nr:MAG TPA: hypothetical protein [Caudoviricetes sp.]